MEKNKVKLTICGAEYIIGSDEDSKYMIELGDEVDEKISTILKQNPRISVTQAAVLAALEFADSEKKAVVFGGKSALEDTGVSRGFGARQDRPRDSHARGGQACKRARRIQKEARVKR